MAQAETFSLPEIMSMKIEALVKAGIFTSKSDVAKEALRGMFEKKPSLNINAAIEMYKEQKVSIGRAAEIAEMSTPDFVDAMAERGVKRIVKSTKERVRKGLEVLSKVRR